MKNYFLIAILAASSPSASAQVSIPNWGADAYGFVANWRGGSISTSPFVSPAEGGGEGFLTDSASLSDPRGLISSSVILNNLGGLSVPVIRTFAQTSSLNGAASASATGIEGYTYTGADTATFILDVNLSGDFANLDNDFAGNFATVSIYGSENFIFTTDSGTLLEFGANRLDTLRLSQNGISNNNSFAAASLTAPHLTSGSLTWTMEPGETVYLFAQGTSRVYGPNSLADASNTLTVSFQDATGLTSLSGGTVPEPSISLLGLLGFMAILRRRR